MSEDLDRLSLSGVGPTKSSRDSVFARDCRVLREMLAPASISALETYSVENFIGIVVTLSGEVQEEIDHVNARGRRW
jgi:hypothetical protein